MILTNHHQGPCRPLPPLLELQLGTQYAPPAHQHWQHKMTRPTPLADWALPIMHTTPALLGLLHDSEATSIAQGMLDHASPGVHCALRQLQAISALLRLAPSTATLQVRDADGHVLTEEEVPSALVQRGDLLKVCVLCHPLTLSACAHGHASAFHDP